MASSKSIEALNKIVNALDGKSQEEQIRAISAALTILGLDAGKVGLASHPVAAGGGAVPAPASHGGAGAAQPRIGTAAEYFDQKELAGKLEEITAAARYRELSNPQATKHTTEELQKVFSDARRNFPANFPRDLENAKKAAYFQRTKEIVLSHFGQKFIDALPDRVKAKAIARPKAGTRARPKKAAKKS